MSKYKNFAFLIIFLEVLLLLLCNGFYFLENRDSAGRLYRVEANRVVLQLQEQLEDGSVEWGNTENQSMIDSGFGEFKMSEILAAIDLSEYESIVRVSEFHAEEVCNNDYIVEEIGGRLYRIEYEAKAEQGMVWYMNGALLIMILLTGTVLFYVERKVLKPFHDMSDLSYELAKGNLSIPIKEEKSKLFGRFLWGMDMLREKLEDNKEKELEFQKDRKTLILSLSHDIKTPLASIELYSKALSGNLYDTKEKQEEALCGIARNVKEIKKYVDEIVTASREDFLNLEVVQGELYLSEIMKATEVYYRDKLSVVHTELIVEPYDDCLLRGDKNRLIEVLQNIMENAIKYGDGQRIRISSEDEEDCKLIHIENTGCNLKEEELPNLFDSFYRGSNSHGVKGNGLGLYICKTLMRKMDGEVFARISGDNFCITVVVRKV
ncbi:MAG: HAMP domain-containing histidine kinase [Lachnospiraceae bacterium]|nr:HAMP domain-containing histidine kinase [Lachnospiraceae bacterium]